MVHTQHLPKMNVMSIPANRSGLAEHAHFRLSSPLPRFVRSPLRPGTPVPQMALTDAKSSLLPPRGYVSEHVEFKTHSLEPRTLRPSSRPGLCAELWEAAKQSIP